MAEIREVVEDTTKTLKKKFKEKPVFFTALGIVIVFAMYKLFHPTEETEETVTNAYVPTGFDGYPSMSDSMMEDYENMLNGGYEGSLGGTTSGDTNAGGMFGGLFDNILGTGDTVTNTDRYYTDEYEDSRYEDLKEKYEDEIAELEQQMLMLQEQQLVLDSSDPTAVYDNLGNLIYSELQPYTVLLDTSSGAGKVQIELETKSNKDFYDSIVAEMRANSSAWNSASSRQEQEDLHNKNANLAKYIGATYKNGTWYASSGAKLFSANEATQPSRNAVTYDKNVDYSAAIKQAVATGASQSVIDELKAKREAKKTGEGLDDYGRKVSNTTSVSSTTSGTKKATVSNASNNNPSNYKQTTGKTLSSSQTTLNGKKVTKTVTQEGNKKVTTYTDSSGKVVAQNSKTVKK